MSIFNIKKDVAQIKETWKQIKETGKKIKEKAPLVISAGKTFFVIVKWLIVVGIIFFIIFGIYVYIKDLQHRKKLEEQRVLLEEQRVLTELKLDCSELCNYSLLSCNERWRSSFEKHGYTLWWDEKCPNIQEEIKCFNDCLK